MGAQAAGAVRRARGQSGRAFVLIAPNNDPGSDAIFRVIDALPKDRFRLLPSMRFAHFSELMKNAACMVGNSSRRGARGAVPGPAVAGYRHTADQPRRCPLDHRLPRRRTAQPSRVPGDRTGAGRRSRHDGFGEGTRGRPFRRRPGRPGLLGARPAKGSSATLPERPAGLLLRALSGAPAVRSRWPPRAPANAAGAGARSIPTAGAKSWANPSLPRPDGPLIWLHAVGLGEVLALRGLIAAMADPARRSAFSSPRPPAPRARFSPRTCRPAPSTSTCRWTRPSTSARFLDHWQPEPCRSGPNRTCGPAASSATAARGIPLALINARMNARAYRSRRRWRGLYADLFRPFRADHRAGRGDRPPPPALGAAGVR